MSTPPEPEYRARILQTTHPESGDRVLSIHIETVREFTSFAYQLSVKVETSSSGAVADVHIGGLTIPPVGRPQPGPARSQVYLPEPPTGSLLCRFHVKKQASDVLVHCDGQGLRLEPSGRQDTVIVVESGTLHDPA